jgi:hypothetical protein
MCQEDFDAKRWDAKTCSGRCRVALHRARREDPAFAAHVDFCMAEARAGREPPDWDRMHQRQMDEWERENGGVPQSGAQYRPGGCDETQWETFRERIGENWRNRREDDGGIQRCACGKTFDRTWTCCGSGTPVRKRCRRCRRWGGCYRTHRKYCSDACKMLAYRRRRRGACSTVTTGLARWGIGAGDGHDLRARDGVTDRHARRYYRDERGRFRCREQPQVIELPEPAIERGDWPSLTFDDPFGMEDSQEVPDPSAGAGLAAWPFDIEGNPDLGEAPSA